MRSKMATASGRAGFTLVETLAALAIASVIIFSTGALLHQSVFFFDHGTRTVDKSEQLALAIESLTRDFAGTRFVLEKSANRTMAAFTGSSASEDAPGQIMFISSGGKAAGPQGEEIISLTVELGDGFAQLVRRRSTWFGPRMHLADAQPGDAVILLKGKYDISFSFSELSDDGTFVWRNSWSGEKGLPHAVRLNLRESETGADLLVGSEFPIHADAPAACAAGEMDCLTLAKANSNPGTNPATAQPRPPRE
jgi:general secretion pathway protein J